jgi:hypothetical protein
MKNWRRTSAVTGKREIERKRVSDYLNNRSENKPLSRHTPDSTKSRATRIDQQVHHLEIDEMGYECEKEILSCAVTKIASP